MFPAAPRETQPAMDAQAAPEPASLAGSGSAEAAESVGAAARKDAEPAAASQAAAADGAEVAADVAAEPVGVGELNIGFCQVKYWLAMRLASN